MELKIKIWYPDSKEMCGPYTPNDFCRKIPSNIESCGKIILFTGLKDKNGVDIYEGDICESYDGDIGVIQWDADTLSFIRFVNFEVKGDIYQHPELLTNK